ncbi:carbohydrate ABC transporter permease [Paenibacillus mendelii]|uniref:Carbohydrate ABC transporter permease n=2 Tax=Paenibacillus mendelii TaxID=206163 RepID=A0ABV6JB39_9BACL
MPILISTIKTVLIQVPLILIFAMFCALLLNKPMRGRLFFRGVYFLPVIVASGNSLKRLTEQGAATLPIFKQYDLYTIMLNYIPEQLLTPLLTMMDSLMIVMWGSGVQIIIFMAGLQSIPVSLYEAAKCDGATPWEVFWKITFPMMMPMILVSTLFTIVDSFTKVDNQMIKYNWTLMFNKLSFGYASAIGWIYFAFVFLVIFIVLFMFRNTSALAQERR